MMFKKSLKFTLQLTFLAVFVFCLVYIFSDEKGYFDNRINYRIQRVQKAALWGADNAVQMTYHAVMDSTSRQVASPKTVLDYSGAGILYVCAFSAENATGHDAFLIIDIDGVKDTLTKVDSTNIQYVIPYDTPDDDPPIMDYYGCSDNTYARADIWFKDYIKLQLYAEAKDPAKQALVFVSYGTAE